jgi:molybdopterin converting factor small subunit
MVVLRLFANLREVAGASSAQIEGSTVAEVLAAAEARFGPDFAAAAATAAIWRNGEAAEPSDSVQPGDELALIPPVSGGTTATGMTVDVGTLAPLAAGAALVLALASDTSAWWAAALVGVGGFWALDLEMVGEEGHRRLPVVAVLFSVVAGALSAEALGAPGWALGVALAVIGTLVWGVTITAYRGVSEVAPGVMVSVLASAAVGSMVLAYREFQAEHQAVSVFLIVVVASTLAGSALERFPISMLDPFTGTALAAVLAAAAGAASIDEDVVGFLLVGIGSAVALIGGRGFGSLIRTGRVSLTTRAPGALSAIDGPLLAAALYFLLLRLVF